MAIFLLGAGEGSRTPVTSLENWDNSRYMTPAVSEKKKRFLFRAQGAYT